VVLQELLNQLKHILESDSEAEQILESLFRKNTKEDFNRLDLVMKLQEKVGSEFAQQALAIAMRRNAGESLQYLLGEQQFLDHRFLVEKGVLIPRPETEVLVREVLQTLPDQQDLKGFELGVGSGIISISILSARPSWKIDATDINPKALMLSRMNADRLLSFPGALQLSTPEKNKIPETKYDFFVSNPPYLSGEDDVTEEVLKNEPREALIAEGNDPDYFYKKIAQEAKEYLKPGGWIFLEIPHERSHKIKEIYEALGSVKVVQDLTKRERVLVVRLS